MAYLPVGSVQTLVVVFPAEAWRTCGLRQQLVVDSNRGLVDDPLVLLQTALDWTVGLVEVPGVVVLLLSREELTRRLLAGAAAPWSPALNPVSKFVVRFVFVLEKVPALAAP